MPPQRYRDRMDDHDRVRLGKMTHPVRGFLHGIGRGGLAGRGDPAARAHPGRRRPRLSLFAFGLSLVALFTTSSLYHSIPWREVWKKRMQQLDHTMIYVLVAGTFTPIAWIVLDGWMRWATLGAQWGIVAVRRHPQGDSRRPDATGSRWRSPPPRAGWRVFLIWPLAHRLPVDRPAPDRARAASSTPWAWCSWSPTGPGCGRGCSPTTRRFTSSWSAAAALHFAVIAGYVARYGVSAS